METYKGKQVLITGGTSGIGLAVAKLLLNQGARVLVTGRAVTSFDSVRAVLGPNAVVVKSDTASLTDIEILADHTKAEFGDLDALDFMWGKQHSCPLKP